MNTSALDGMPNAFLEAWAQGFQCLRCSSIPTVVERERLGVSSHGSRDRFVEGARELWRGRDDRGESRRVRAYVEGAHSMEAVGAEWNPVIAEVCAARRAERRRPGR